HHRQPDIILGSRRQRPPAPGVVTSSGNVQRVAEDPDRVVGLLRIDEDEPQRCSLAKKATVGSTGRCNSTGDSSARRQKSKCLAWAAVEPQSDHVEIMLAVG